MIFTILCVDFLLFNQVTRSSTARHPLKSLNPRPAPPAPARTSAPSSTTPPPAHFVSPTTALRPSTRTSQPAQSTLPVIHALDAPRSPSTARCAKLILMGLRTRRTPFKSARRNLRLHLRLYHRRLRRLSPHRVSQKVLSAIVMRSVWSGLGHARRPAPTMG